MNRTTILPLLLDLLRLVGFIRQKRPRLLKNGLPGKRTLHDLNQILLTPRSLEGVKNFQQSGYLLFLYELAYQLDLFIDLDGQLKPNKKRCEEFFFFSYKQQQQELRKAYLRMVLWNEFQQVPTLTFRPPQESYQTSPITMIQMIHVRRNLLKLLPELLDEPQSLSFVLHTLKTNYPSISQLSPPALHTPYEGIWLSTTAQTARQAFYPDDWESVEAPFLAQILTLSMHWLGWIALDYRDEPILSVTEDFALSVNDSFSHSEPSRIVQQNLLVQANLEILVFPAPRILSLLYVLEQFCKPAGGDQLLTYRLDKKTFFTALQQGISYQECLEFLRRHSRIELPKNIAQIMRSWHEQGNQIVISQNGAFIEASSTKELQEWLRNIPSDLSIIHINDLTVFVPAHALSTLRNHTSRDKILNVDYTQSPPRSINIQADLKVELDTQQQDLFTENFIKKIARPIKETQPRPSHCKTYKIDHKTLNHALDLGLPFDEIMEFLIQRTKIFSSTAKLRLEALGAQLGAVFAGSAELLLAPNQRTLERLLYEGGLEKYTLRIGLAAAIIIPEHKQTVLTILDTFDLPNQTQANPTPDALFHHKK